MRNAIRTSRFHQLHGILLAADVSDENRLFTVLDQVGEYIAAIKLGNSVLYRSGVSIVNRLKKRFNLPIVADLKLTDVSHIATQVVRTFQEEGTDAIVLSGICGHEVLRDAIEAAGDSCEIWVFTEFTNDSGLIDKEFANYTIRVSRGAGVVGLQVPGTRPDRIEEARQEVGNDVAIIACGIGVQGGRFGSAIRAGANLEIIGRAIYSDRSPAAAASEAYQAIRFASDKFRANGGL